MKRMMQFSTALVMALAVTACAGDDARETDATPATGTGGAVTGTSGTFDGDREFVEEHLALGNAEVELGRIAQERATHADVKEFAAMMVREHQAAGEELRQIANTAAANATTPLRTEAREDLADLREEMAKLSGRDFDRRYIDEMIDDHEEAVDDLEDKAENASHPQVKAWAAKTLPAVRQHLERAKSIKEALEGTDN
jgi:putative membrane protein